MRRFNVSIGDFIINDVPIRFSYKLIRNSVLSRARIFDSIDIFFDGRTKSQFFALYNVIKIFCILNYVFDILGNSVKTIASSRT